MVIALSPAIEVNGTDLSQDWQENLLEVVIDRQYRVPTRCTLRFTDPGYQLAAAAPAPASEVIIQSPSGSTLVTAEVTGLEVEQRPGEQPELIVVAHDKSHRLARGTAIKSYQQMTISDIVTSVISDAGLTAIADSTSESFDYVLQVGSAMEFINELADRVGFDWYMDGKTFYFAKPSSQGQVSLALGARLLSFSVEANVHGCDTVEVHGWDSDQQQTISSGALSANGVHASSTLTDSVINGKSSFGSASVVSGSLGVRTASEATNVAQALVNRSAAAGVTARGVVQGDVGLVLGDDVSVTDAGPLSGTYPVTRVQHVFRPDGLVTRFESGDRRPTSLADALGGSGAGARGSLFYSGVTVGVVTNINDPNKTGRVKVRYPGFDTDDESGWARLVAAGGGASRGSVFIPEVNDEVLVAFEGGDLRQPIVIGGLFGAKSTMPTTSVDSGVVVQRGMTSRLGHVIQLSDGTGDNEQYVLLALAGQQTKLRLGKDEVDLAVPSGTPLNITAGDTSIKIGNDGSLTIAAPKISIQATGELQLQGASVSVSANGELQLSGQAAASLQGATVKISGDGPAQIQGNPVMIN